MLRTEDNELLCRIGPGTQMGDFMREYWIPALTSVELPEPDCAPLRVRLLGEDLIAFRASSGAVGLIGSNCPHRGASLFFGRNEEAGLRCVYHGWKFDVSGQCVDMPSEPAESNFKDKIRATAYPCVERGGVVWAYLGPRATPPPLSDIEANLLPDGEFSVTVSLRECNWVQALEGDIDTSHLGYLHMGAAKPETMTPGSFDYYIVADRTPRYQVLDNEAGTTYGAYRPATADTMYWRVAHFLFPFYTMIPTGQLGVQVFARAWVPADDEHVWVWAMTAPRTRQGVNAGGAATPLRAAQSGGLQAAATASAQATGVVAGGFGMNYRPNTSDWLGRFRLRQNRENDYEIDREAQRTQTFTGLAGVNLEDQAITESMGSITNRSREHLGTSDAMIVRTRRRLIDAAKAFREDGIAPPGVDTPGVYRMRSGGVLLPKDADWLEATKHLQRVPAS